MLDIYPSLSLILRYIYCLVFQGASSLSFSYTLSVYSCHTSVLQKCYIHPVVTFILIHSFFYTICRKVSV
ncbi:hypothetical protein FQO34_19890 [Salmonella enterica]|nr:hypothetical protein [Salmonella enterica]